MKPAKKTDDSHLHANPYNLFRADGRAPFNGHFWPTESWWLGHEHRRFNCRWNFGYVALQDGRFCVEGCVYNIHENTALYHHERGKAPERPNNFTTREAAIRAACGRLIREMRGSQTWDSPFHGGLKGKDLEFAINWALQRCADVCKAHRRPRTVTIHIPKPPPPPPRIQTPAASADPWDNL